MMKQKRIFVGLVWAALTLALFGCKGPKPPGPINCDADKVRIGDRLTITFVLPTQGPDNGDKVMEVRQDGSINMPLIGSQPAAGKTFAELERDLQAKYVPNIYARLTLLVKAGERFYTVAGEVKQPGRQLYFGSTTVLRAIASGGDFTDFANRKKVEVIRTSGKRELVDCKLARKDPRFDLPICPGDAIYVPRSF